MTVRFLSNGSSRPQTDYVSCTIKTAEQRGNALLLGFTDGTVIRIQDNGQECCENLYMRTDDNLSDLVGHRFVGISVNSITETTDIYGNEHEIVFLDVKTDGGMITFSFHNEHNGHYGGFGLDLDEVSP